MTNRELLIRAGRACREMTRRPLRKIGLQPAQDDLLLALACMSQPTSLSDFGRQLGISGPSMTKSVTRLVAMGLAEVHGDPADGRMRRPALTDKGRRLIERVKAIHEDVEAMIRAGIVMAPGTLTDKLGAIVVALEPKTRRRRL